MWIVKIDGEFVKTDTPEKISGYLLKKMKTLRDIVELKDPRLLTAVETCLSTGEQQKLDVASHELKIIKDNSRIKVDIYLKFPSAGSKMKIQEHVFDLEIINIEDLKSL
jgi:hypothetical protein